MNTTTTTTRTAVADVRRGDTVVDGAGAEFLVTRVACPMDDMNGVYFTFAGVGTFRYLTNDHVQVVAG